MMPRVRACVVAILASAFAAGAASAQPPSHHPRLFVVYFNTDRAELTSSGAKVVQQAAAYYKANPHLRVKIDGFTDLAGSQGYNLDLSQRRAETVAKAMMAEGVPPEAITSVRHGKANPRVPTADGVREARNRRVEISE